MAQCVCIIPERDRKANKLCSDHHEAARCTNELVRKMEVALEHNDECGCGVTCGCGVVVGVVCGGVMLRSVEWSCKESGHDVGPDVFGRAVVDLGVGEEVAEGKEKEEGEECVGVAVGTAAEPGATSDMSSSDAKWLIYAHSLC
ncbi:unnamed protein product [Mesocestoides corti]|uniref:Uncharacterized protein n=1 Tax=Mesocestoides corti TaxID=53468 RepID=A0A0R3UB69_MESCO|nr:unnamed protein product [Mesocestoides corti]